MADFIGSHHRLRPFYDEIIRHHPGKIQAIPFVGGTNSRARHIRAQARGRRTPSSVPR
jgi:hypothetical protein